MKGKMVLYGDLVAVVTVDYGDMVDLCVFDAPSGTTYPLTSVSKSLVTVVV